MKYDILIIGAGPAGLTAAANASSRGLKTLVLEAKNTYGGQPNTIYPLKTIIDLPGFPQGIQAGQYCKYLFDQMKVGGAEIKFDNRVVKMELNGEVKKLTTQKDEVYEGDRVIIASGHMALPKKLPQLKGDEDVTYILREPVKYSGKKVVVIGGGNTAVDNAFQLIDYADSVTLIHRRDMLRTKESMKDKLEQAGANILFNTELKEVQDGTCIIVNNQTKEETTIDTDAVIINIGYELAPANLDLSMFEQHEDKSIKVDCRQMASINGVFAAGDVTGEVKLITVACAEGIVAAIHTFESIKKPYWL